MDRIIGSHIASATEASAPTFSSGESDRLPTNVRSAPPGRDAPSSLMAALTCADICVLRLNEQGRILAINPPCQAVFGRPAADLIGESLGSLLRSADAQRHSVISLDAGGIGGSAGSPFLAMRPDGSARWLHLVISPIRQHNDGAMGAVVIVQDITDQREAGERLRKSEEHHRNYVELSPQINWTASASGMIEEASPRWAAVTGGRAEDALGIGWLGAVHPDDIPQTVATWTKALEAKVALDVEYRLRMPSSGYRWFRSRATARLDANGNVVRWYGTLEDIDDRRGAEQSLRESEERFRLAAQTARLGIWDYDALQDRRSWSDEFKDMLGLHRDAAPDVATAMALVVDEDRHLLAALIDAVKEGKSEHRFEVTLRIRRADTGAERWMQTGGWRIDAPNGRLGRVLVTIRDTTDERTTEDRIRWAATHDAFTRLPNRAHFTDRFEAAIARAETNGTRLALVLFDVDNLKATNDTVGHDAGDRLLLAATGRLRDGLGEAAFLSRLGGDEFAAFVIGTEEESVVARVNATLELLREPFSDDDGTLDCQATAGLSFYPAHGCAATDLLKAADVALYVGKAGRRGALSIFHPEMRAGLQRRASMLAVARAAARDSRIRPHYQPKVRLEDGKIVGFEALLRWQHDTLGIQHPQTISAAFEDFRLACLIGEQMFELICADMTHWLDRGIDVGSIAFNLSAAEFRREDLVDHILERLRRGGIPASMIELEITETVFLGRGADTVSATLDAFHRAGMRIALDDFGTGYASLTHLQAFPVDAIKIDRAFVANVIDGPGDAAIVDAMIGLARRLEMDVVAEGIETQAQADYLIRQGCGVGQGYLFGRAMPASEVEAHIQDALWPRISNLEL